MPCDIATCATDMPGSSHCASTIDLNCDPYRRRVFPLALPFADHLDLDLHGIAPSTKQGTMLPAESSVAELPPDFGRSL